MPRGGAPFRRRRSAAATALGRRACGAAGNVAVDDAGLAQIVGRHLERDLVAGQNADVVLAHFSAGVGHYVVTIVEGDAKTGIGQDFGDETAHFDEFFLSHMFSFCGSNKIQGRRWATGAKTPGARGAWAFLMRSMERIGGDVPGRSEGLRLMRRSGRIQEKRAKAARGMGVRGARERAALLQQIPETGVV